MGIEHLDQKTITICDECPEFQRTAALVCANLNISDKDIPDAFSKLVGLFDGIRRTKPSGIQRNTDPNAGVESREMTFGSKRFVVKSRIEEMWVGFVIIGEIGTFSFELHKDGQSGPGTSRLGPIELDRYRAELVGE